MCLLNLALGLCLCLYSVASRALAPWNLPFHAPELSDSELYKVRDFILRRSATSNASPALSGAGGVENTIKTNFSHMVTTKTQLQRRISPWLELF